MAVVGSEDMDFHLPVWEQIASAVKYNDPARTTSKRKNIYIYIYMEGRHSGASMPHCKNELGGL